MGSDLSMNPMHYSPAICECGHSLDEHEHSGNFPCKHEERRISAKDWKEWPKRKAKLVKCRCREYRERRPARWV